MALHNLNKKNTTEDLRILRFGKYKGQTILGVIQDDPRYIKWCLDNIETFKLNDQETELFLISYNDIDDSIEHYDERDYPYTYQGEVPGFFGFYDFNR